MRASGKGGQPGRQELGQCYARDGYGVGLLTADQPERQVQGGRSCGQRPAKHYREAFARASILR